MIPDACLPVLAVPSAATRAFRHRLAWRPCNSRLTPIWSTGLLCANATVPLDYCSPSRGGRNEKTIDIAVIKLPALARRDLSGGAIGVGRTRRIGTLFINFGTEGGVWQY